MAGVAENDDLVAEVDGGVVRLRINRPDAGNALTQYLRDDLTERFRALSADPAVRVVVLTGTGKAFCTGADLRGGKKPAADRPEGAPERIMGDAARLIREGWQRLITSILDCEKPVIAAVNGTAAGGGAHLAIACDLVLMAEGARFIEVFIRRGIIPDAGGAYLLPRLVGLQRAKELMFFGDDLSAADAERIGLANRVVAADELDAVAAEWAARLAAGPTRALASIKWLLNRSFESDRATALHEEAFQQELVNGTHDAREGIVSFVERREAEFRGW